MTFYQDIQQEEFWAVGVRMFGFHLLHYRSLREGSRLNLLYQYNVHTKKFAWSYAGDPSRISGDLPFQMFSDAFRDKLQKLETVITSTPLQRAARNFGQQILRSAKEEDAFWSSHTAQEESMKQIFIQAAQPGTTREEQIELITNMARLSSEAAYFHQSMIASVLSSEQASGTIHQERRQSLLLWNRSCRQFMNELLSCCNPNTDRNNIEKLEHDLVGLETCRMRLWSPIFGPHATDDSREHAELIFAHTTKALRRKVCNKILGDARRSIFARCCAEIMICALDAEVFDGWQQRRDQLTKHVTTITKLVEQNITDWIDPLNEWGNIALQTRELIVQRHQAVGQG